MPVQSIIEHIGLPDAKYHALSGGDINSCWRIEAGGEKYFLKINSAIAFPGMFQKETGGLEALRNHSTFLVPVVIETGIAVAEQFLLMEWLDEGTHITKNPRAGEKLAALHLKKNDWFGWNENNYIGSLPQLNTRKSSWPSFYADCRILPLVKVLFDKKHISHSEMICAERFCLRLAELFPTEPASLLHGDLWAGNYMNTSKGPAIYDPAVYYGHREMDIGMTKLFGGFDPGFYAGYNQVYPLEKGWEKRVVYAQVYPLLVHAILFGGPYVQRAVRIMRF